jgi:hypothetical protein
MSFSMSKASIPALELGLNALSGVLDKAQVFATAKKVDPSVLLTSRLRPDMFALTRQVQVATDLAKNGMARLAGVDYLNHFILPNVYFHLTAAYAILRHSGVELGKQDYLGAIPMKMT